LNGDPKVEGFVDTGSNPRVAVTDRVAGRQQPVYVYDAVSGGAPVSTQTWQRKTSTRSSVLAIISTPSTTTTRRSSRSMRPRPMRQRAFPTRWNPSSSPVASRRSGRR
jgi:hypothetical protein